ncbi:hypothetical protein HKK52_09105 [Pseudomonas sp. ADAK2]|uniref:hypothetical protein n=1 Tax=unclassified Pseudomonas TaxID=196821 RepID=UPI001463ED24|nr:MULTISPECIES: hypothetical protein [unclassified Pseudomonas]QJI41070.1 hypothetical protein HKK53_09100 [Pseudomonas sp. ADAK7]QJI47375.1 hypothetical protein HKK52_09105 [Pseudomonas sp. ADAK2]
MFKHPLTEVAAFAFLFMMCSSIALADSRACSDPQVKEALALKAQNSRNSYVDMLNRQGRSVWAKVSGIHEVETLSSNKESRRKKCFAKASMESNMGMLAQPVWMTYTLGQYDDGKQYTEIHVMSADERQSFSRDR